ncbi:MAG: sugar phosphate isomerase/epimerase family protein [Chloroflexota bacterium]
MRLSLSVRIAELQAQKDRAFMPLEELAPLAREVGFQGLSMRASAVSVDSPPERVQAVRQLLDGLGLAVSMVTGDVPLAANTGDVTRVLREPMPYVRLAQALNCDLIRVMVRTDEEVDLLRTACDTVAAEGIRIAHQTHFFTLLETVDEALDIVKRVDRPNFGITFEPANLLICGSEYGRRAIERLAPYLFNAYFQNMRITPDGPVTWRSRTGGPEVRAAYAPIGDRTAIDVSEMISALRDVGYDGWFSIHQPLQPGQTVEEAIRESYAAVGHLVR